MYTFMYVSDCIQRIPLRTHPYENRYTYAHMNTQLCIYICMELICRCTVFSE